MKSYTEKQIQEVLMYVVNNQDLSLKEISEHFSISSVTIGSWLKRVGIKKQYPRKKSFKIDWEKIAKSVKNAKV